MPFHRYKHGENTLSSGQFFIAAASTRDCVFARIPGHVDGDHRGTPCKHWATRLSWSHPAARRGARGRLQLFRTHRFAASPTRDTGSLNYKRVAVETNQLRPGCTLPFVWQHHAVSSRRGPTMPRTADCILNLYSTYVFTTPPYIINCAQTRSHANLVPSTRTAAIRS